MKIKSFLILSVLFWTICFNVHAYSINVNDISSSEINNETFINISFFCDDTRESKIGSIEIIYDPSLFEYNKYSFLKDNLLVNSHVDNNKVILDFSYYNKENSDLKIVFKNKNTGIGSFNININADENISVIKNANVYNANLSSLSLSSGVVNPSFNPNITSYNATIESDFVNLYTSLEDPTSSLNIPLSTTLSLDYGYNTFDLIVTSKFGISKTYTLKLYRPDYRSDDSSLKKITLSSGTIDFKSDIFNYHVILDSSVDSLSVEGLVNDNKALISYPNGKIITLEPGESGYLIIEVISERGTISNYQINVSRDKIITNDDDNSGVTDNNGKAEKNNVGPNKAKKVLLAEDDNYLKKLKVSNINFHFDKEVNNYVFTVNNNISTVEVNYELSNQDAKVVFEGNNELNLGENNFTIEVISVSGKKRKYNILIFRRPFNFDNTTNEAEIINGINNNNDSDNITILVDKVASELVLTSKILKASIKQNKKIIYEYYDGSTLNYRLIIDPRDIKETNDTVIKLNTSESFDSYFTSKKYHPFNISSTGSIGGVTLESFNIKNDNLCLYNFDKSSEKFNDITKTLNIKNGIVNFKINSFSKTYILAPSSIFIGQLDVKNSLGENITMGLIAVLFILIILHILFRSKKKKNIK